ncbi:PH domain-containing protein [Actinomadura parmotrematis]|uniref:PH domain-containing protein n=1 Tax=Actinomadura parmotrematis TaxID=2864039 RepID=UPI0027E2FADB|nr:PH domain-containing protein [Actinomadura parmotrematis]
MPQAPAPPSAPPPAPRQPGGPPPHAQPHYPVDAVFATGDGRQWARLSRRYPWERRISMTLWAVLTGAVGALVLWRSGGTLAAILWTAAVVLATVLGWIAAELAYRAYGYAERADDLIVTHGVLVKRLIVVPYGRMQFVDVTAGLLERWFGVATVRMHTAAAATDARIPGLPADEAARLRDSLARKGEERSMGL